MKSMFMVLAVLAICVDWADGNFNYNQIRKCSDGIITCYETAAKGSIWCERNTNEIAR